MGRKSKSTPSEAAVSKAAVAYVRVSTEEQAKEGVSLEAQEARPRAYCTAQGLELVAVLREEGASAASPLASRPGAELLALIAAGQAGQVIAARTGGWRHRRRRGRNMDDDPGSARGRHSAADAQGLPAPRQRVEPARRRAARRQRPRGACRTLLLHARWGDADARARLVRLP